MHRISLKLFFWFVLTWASCVASDVGEKGMRTSLHPALFHQSMKKLVGDSQQNRKQGSLFDTLYTDKPLKNPSVALAFSAFIPGSGHWYLGKKGKGLFFFVTETALAGYVIHLHQKHDSRRSDFTWLLGLIHFYNMMDAMIDAYLIHFDKMLDKQGSRSNAP